MLPGSSEGALVPMKRLVAPALEEDHAGGGRRTVTADTALILGRVFGNSADFWLNTQRRTDLWEALNTPQRVIRIERARPLEMARLRRVKPQQVHGGLSIAASAERKR